MTIHTQNYIIVIVITKENGGNGMREERINLIQAIKYPIGTKFEVMGNVSNMQIVESNVDEDGDIATKKLIWEDGSTVFATDYELSLELEVIK